MALTPSSGVELWHERPERRDGPAADTLVRLDDAQVGRLGNHRHVRFESAFDQFLHAEEGVFLIDRAGHDDVAGAARLLADQSGERRQHRRHAALDVAGAAAVEPAILDAGPERINGHVVGRHRVLVRFQDQGRAAPRRVEAGQDVVALRRDGLALERHTEAAEELFQIGRDAMLVQIRRGAGRGPSG